MPWVILAVSLLALGLLFLAGRALKSLMQNLVTSLLDSLKESQKGLTSSLTMQQELTRDLLNRMMSKDLQTYAAMSTLTSSLPTSNEEYVNRSDAAEVERLASFAGSVPVGDTLYTEDDIAQGLMSGIGLDDLTDLAEQMDK